MVRQFDSPIITTDQSVDRVLKAGLPVTLVFTNSDVPLTLEETLNRLAQDHKGQLLVVKINFDEGRETARRYQVHNLPALVTIRNNQVQSSAQVVSPGDVEKHVAYLLGNRPKPTPPQPSHSPGGQGSSGTPLTVTDTTFEREVLQATEPVLIDFWAPWCGPCRMVEPTVKKLASELAGRLRVAKVNVDENPHVASRYGVQSIPAMMVVKNGQIIDRWAGALPEAALRNRVMKVL